ncbi:Coiled-coil domain-containing 40, partial [Brachionus plicatilis]
TETKSSLEKNYDLTTNDFIECLKEAERSTIQLQDKIELVKKEKEQLLKDLIDVDEQIMAWERKIELAKEMKQAVDSDAGQGEIKEMKFEIHRMTVRYDDLRNQQEKLIRQMEAAVLRRDTIMTRGELTQKNPQIVTQGKLQREIAEIAKKIKSTGQDTSRIESEIRLLKDKQQQLTNILEDKQHVLKNLHESDEAKNMQLEELSRKKQENMEELLMKQRRVKYYDQLKHGKYTLLAKQDTQNEQETMKQLDRLRSLGTIVNKLSEEYPNLQPIIRKVESSIQVRLNQEEEDSEKK